MSDVKFLCPHCGQKISCDTGYCGTQISCPTCQKGLTVPSAPLNTAAPAAVAVAALTSAGPVRVPTPTAAAVPLVKTATILDAPGRPPQGPPTTLQPPPIPLVGVPPPAAQPGVKPLPAKPGSAAKASGYSYLAIASLLCSVWVPLGFIPGILFGHLAKGRLRRHLFLKGDGMATAGLLISYAVLSVILISSTAFALVNRHYRPIQVVRESPEALAALTPRIVDEVLPGQSPSEDQHGVDGQNSSESTFSNKPLRHAFRGGSFSYVMKVLPNQPMAVNCRYWGGERAGRTFDIAVDNQIIATQDLNFNVPGHFFDMEYVIPTRLTRGKNQVKIEFQAQGVLTAGGLFGLQTLKR